MRKFEFVKDYNNEGKLPTRADNGSAGYDFYTPYTLEIAPKSTVVFKTNVKAAMEKDEVLLLYVRSSIGIKKHLMLCNGTGVIDSTYYGNQNNDGNIMGALYNYGDEAVRIEAGDRVMQGVFTKYLITEDDAPLSSVRTGGIGSSGV